MKTIEKGIKMATNVVINEELLASALKAGGLKTKKGTVNLALKEFIQKRKRKEAIKLFGKLDFTKNWSPKKARGKLRF